MVFSMLERGKYGTDNKKMFDSLPTDLSKVFDSLWSELLMAKLNAHGFRITV